MNAYQYFGLQRPPFQNGHDPRFFFASPGHEEALATLQYTVLASKSCCVLVGDSGLGKTTVGRMVCRTAGRLTTVLWVHGIGQPDDATEVSLLAPATAGPTPSEPALQETTLSEWIRSGRSHSRPPLLIIDNADELPPRAWRDILSVLTRDVGPAGSANVILLGMPRLQELLAQPELVRLRRRIFRTCRLDVLSPELVRAYVDSRFAAAGGNAAEIFSRDAIAHIHAVTHGIPGLINQVCENALLDAFSDSRKRIEAAHILPAVDATVGRDVFEPTPAPPPMERRSPLRIEPRALPAPQATVCRNVRATVQDVVPKLAAIVKSRREQTIPTVSVGRRVTSDAALENRLRQLESRLSHALSVVKKAREMRERGANLALERPPAPPPLGPPPASVQTEP